MFVIRQGRQSELIKKNCCSKCARQHGELKRKNAVDARFIVLALRGSHHDLHRGWTQIRRVHSSCAHQSLGKWPCHLSTRHWRTAPCGCQRRLNGDLEKEVSRIPLAPLPMKYWLEQYCRSIAGQIKTFTVRTKTNGTPQFRCMPSCGPHVSDVILWSNYCTHHELSICPVFCVLSSVANMLGTKSWEKQIDRHMNTNKHRQGSRSWNALFQGAGFGSSLCQCASCACSCGSLGS